MPCAASSSESLVEGGWAEKVKTQPSSEGKTEGIYGIGGKKERKGLLQQGKDLEKE